MRKLKKVKPARLLCFFLLCLLGVIMLYPLFIIVNVSFKSYKEYLNSPLNLVLHPTLENFKVVWEGMNVIPTTLNTLWLTAIACGINIVICILAAFPISRGYFRGANKLYTFILASMFFPTSLVATITLVQRLGLYGSSAGLLAIWITGSLQLNTFMLVGFVKGLPRDLDEAAFIEGCGYFRYLLTIAMPLMKPIVVTIVVLRAIGCWNDFLNPYIYMGNTPVKTLSTGLYLYMGQFASKWNLLSAAIFIVAVPMIILYIFAQRYIIEGMTSGAVKG